MRNTRTGFVRVRGQDDTGCCSVVFLKYCLFVFNVFFWLSGFALLAIGLWTLLDKHTYASLLVNVSYVIATYLLLAAGGAILLLGWLGCCGAWRENRGCLLAFGSLLFVVFALEVAIGVLAYLYQTSVYEELVANLNDTMLTSYMYKADKTAAIDDMQRTFHCCGAGSFHDWLYSRWLTSSPSSRNQSSLIQLSAPESCCFSESPQCSISNHPSNIYYEGCIDQLNHYIHDHLTIVGALGFGVCALQIFGVIFACCLARRLKKWKDSQNAHAWM